MWGLNTYISREDKEGTDTDQILGRISVPDRRTVERPDAGCMTKVCGIGNMKGVKA